MSEKSKDKGEKDISSDKKRDSVDAGITRHPSLNLRTRATWDSLGPKRAPRMSGRYYIIRAVLMLIVLGFVIYTRSRLSGH